MAERAILSKGCGRINKDETTDSLPEELKIMGRLQNTGCHRKIIK
jgi:hypothetical protein